MNALLELRGVGKAFGPRVLFRRLSWAVRPGSVTLLAGQNGSGKSTLMRVMAGLTPADSGEVVRNVAPERVGYLAHHTFVYPGLTARENLMFWARLAGAAEPEADALRALARVDLARHAEERAGVFSRGMAQRLNLARLLLAEPDLVLLDEPCTGLDTASRGMVYAMVAEAKARGAGVVWISHDVAGDAARADAVLELTRGELVPHEATRAEAVPC